MKDYIFSNDFYKNIDAMVLNSGNEVCAPSHAYGPAVRSSYMIHYIRKGKGIYVCGGKTYHLSANDAFLIKPGERIYYEADAQDPWEYTWIGMQGVKIESYLKRTSIFDDYVFSYPPHTELLAFHERLEEANRSWGMNQDLRFNGILYEYLYALCRAFPKADPGDVLKKEAYLEEILVYIENNFDQPISVGHISEMMALDRTYIHKIFKRKMGMSIKEYIVQIRMTTACSLLRYTNLSISDISRSVGYADVLYFSKSFRQKKGCSPSEYRAQKQTRTPSV